MYTIKSKWTNDLQKRIYAYCWWELIKWRDAIPGQNYHHSFETIMRGGRTKYKLVFIDWLNSIDLDKYAIISHFPYEYLEKFYGNMDEFCKKSGIPYKELYRLKPSLKFNRDVSFESPRFRYIQFMKKNHPEIVYTDPDKYKHEWQSQAEIPAPKVFNTDCHISEPVQSANTLQQGDIVTFINDEINQVERPCFIGNEYVVSSVSGSKVTIKLSDKTASQLLNCHYSRLKLISKHIAEDCVFCHWQTVSVKDGLRTCGSCGATWKLPTIKLVSNTIPKIADDDKIDGVLKLSIRALNGLDYMKCFTIGDLKKLSADDLFKQRYLGKATVNEIYTKLKDATGFELPVSAHYRKLLKQQER